MNNLIGKTVYLDLGQIGMSKLKILDYKDEIFLLEHWNGKRIQLTEKTFKTCGGKEYLD